MEATVYCKSGRVIKFTKSNKDDMYYHTTKYGNIYALIADPDLFKPIWIGRYFDDNNPSWVTYEGNLQAEYVELPLGGRYYFP